jgi:SulP family sulfate permease
VLRSRIVKTSQLTGATDWRRAGLHATAVCSFPAAALASSRYLQTGCVAMTSLLAAGALAGAGLTPGTVAYAAAAPLLALIVGASRVALAALNGGALLARIPPAVLDGFTLGVVWLVFATQLPVCLGVAVPRAAAAHFVTSASWALLRPALWHWGTIVTAGATAACLLLGKRCAASACMRTRAASLDRSLTLTHILCLPPLRRLHPVFPGAIVACVLGCIASSAGLAVGPTVGARAPLSEARTHVRACSRSASHFCFSTPLPHAGAVHAGLPSLLHPSALPWHLLPALAPAGAAIAVAGFAEAAAVSSRFAADDAEKWDCNRELLSQGAANLAAGAFGGYPVGGSLSRTSLARTAGATTQRAHAITGAAVLAFLPAGAGLLAALPRAVLGGLVAVAMLPLMRPAPTLLSASAAASAATRAGAWPMRDRALGWITAAATILVRRHAVRVCALCAAISCLLTHSLMYSIRSDPLPRRRRRVLRLASRLGSRWPQPPRCGSPPRRAAPPRRRAHN